MLQLVPRDGGAFTEEPKAPSDKSLERDPLLAERVDTAYDDSRRGTDHGADLGAGSGRVAAFSFDQEGHQLLRAVRAEKSSADIVSGRRFRNSATNISNGPDRGGENGATL